MTRRLLLAFLAATLGALSAPSAPAATAAAETAQSPLRIAFIAYQNPDQLLENVAPVARYLESALGRPVETFAATDYAGVVEALKNETADAGFMGPLQYIIANRQAGARPILAELYNGSATYESHVFVRKDSGIDSLAELEGKTIAFVDPLSSSGYLYPLQTFVTADLIDSAGAADSFFRKVYFAGGDEQAVRAVLNRFVDAAGVGQYSVGLLRPEEREAMRILGRSRPIPSHCVVVREGLDEGSAQALQEALLALNEGPDRPLLRHLYSVDGYAEATHKTYSDVEALARELGFID